MNPYASYLGEQSPLLVIAATPGRLAAILAVTGIEGADRSPAPGKWSVREIFCHLADCEIVFAYRLRQGASQDHHVIQPFDQDEWAKNYSAYTADAALELFSATRRWNLTMLEALPAAAFNKPLTHPERGDMTFQTVVETMARPRSESSSTARAPRRLTAPYRVDAQTFAFHRGESRRDLMKQPSRLYRTAGSGLIV